MIIKRLEKIFDIILEGLSYLCGTIFIFVMIVVCIDVMLRYLFNSPTIWVIEISEYLLVYLTFLGTAWVLKQDGHICVDIFVSRLRPKARAITGIISSIIGVLVCLFISFYGAIETLDNFRRGVHVPSLLEFPKAPLLAVIPFGVFLLMIQFIRNTLRFINELNEKKNGNERNKA